ncbi:hypothetical protein JZ751_010109 [Albula glossodonta]|uniref:Anoctamin n=1 Tax=Albula glossodonta TaxID=121402 RepID=A0A8T2N0Z3_9TELE|nr:hypothetical protein JZ751_010109 [Albula glossodonta]
MFLFQFVNYYSSCFYIAFFKGKVVGYPGEPVYWLGKYRNEEGDLGGFGGLPSRPPWGPALSALGPAHGWVCPLAKRGLVCPWSAAQPLARDKSESLEYNFVECDWCGDPHHWLFGFVTLFVASFPLAPLLALLNNLFELRVDAWKITTQFRRIVPEKAQDIGAWQPILQGVAILAVTTNAMIIAFTSDMIPRLVYYWSFSVYPYGERSNNTMEGYINHTFSVFNIQDFSPQSRPINTPYWFHNITSCRYRDFRNPPGHPKQYEHNIYYWHVIAAKLAFIIVLEHIVYFTKFVLSYMIPDVPAAVKEQIKREKYLTQVILHEANLKLATSHTSAIASRTEVETRLDLHL